MFSLWWPSIESWLLLATATILFGIYVRRKHSLLKSLNIPHGDPGFLGLNAIIAFMKDPNYVVYKKPTETRKILGDIYGSYFGLSPIVTVWDPEVLKQIYIKEFRVFPDRQKNFLKINGKLKDGLMSIIGSQWKRVRSSLSPSFSSSKLKEMFPLVNECSENLLANIQKSADSDQGQFDVKSTIGRFTMDTICSAAFSRSFHTQDGDKEPELVRIFRETTAKDLFKNPVMILLMLCPSLEFLIEKVGYSIFGKEFENLLGKIGKNMTAETGSNQRADFMQLMLKQEISEKDSKTATKGLTRKEIIANSSLMIFAGYETTSTAILFLLYNLALHNDCQERLREEVRESMERHGGELNYEAVQDLKYMTMCINESLRLYSPVPLNQRFCDEDITIKGKKFIKGIIIQVPVFGLAHHEDYWEEPYSYNPERMEDMSKIDPMVFQPFGGGPRNCIGIRLAMIIIKLATAQILLKFRLEPTASTPKPPLEMIFGATAGPKEKIELKAILLDG